MSLEVIVRPATVTPVLQNQRPPSEVESEDDSAYIEWGSGPLSLTERSDIYDGYGSGGGGGLQPFYQLDESNRTTHIVRVSNPDNPNIYVDVEVIDRITFFGLSGLWEYRFNNPV